MKTLRWEAVRAEFSFDGSWRDIYVLGTDISVWQRMFDGLRSARYELAYSRGGQPADLPSRAEDSFPDEGECDRLLSVRFCGVLANCHFFTADEIEFDIDPREVHGQVQLDALLAFMRCLATSTGRNVLLCPENTREIAIFRMSPNGMLEYYQVYGGSDERT